MELSPLDLVFVGHVDHGKSTLIGRLLHDTGAVSEDRIAAVRRASARRGRSVEWAFLLDALQAERDQGVTIDVSRIGFRTKKRDCVIVDAPGHREFLRNMVTGASDADAALLVIDVAEGVREQTRRHAHLLSLMGISQVAVLVTKMDLAGFEETVFRGVERDIRDYLERLGMSPRAVLPVSSASGDNITAASPAMRWFGGDNVVSLLDRLEPRPPLRDLPLRLPVQDVHRFDERRIVVGRIESGVLHAGDRLHFSPSGRTAGVRSIEAWSVTAPSMSAEAGESTAIILDEDIFLERGEVASHAVEVPLLTNVFRARMFWLGRRTLTPGSELFLRIGTARHRATLASIDRVIDSRSLTSREAVEISRDDCAEVVLRTQELIAVDEARNNPRLGRFVLVDDYRTAGGGTISMEGYPDQRELVTVRSTNIALTKSTLDRTARWGRNGHKGGVLWLTGLSGAGKSTIALGTERLLFEAGIQVYVLDGDNVRHGLTANLGFSPEDRAENVRRVGEVAALFADAGFVVIASFISPYRSDRERARSAAADMFHEVYIRADLRTCEARDPKGLYKRARAGQIPDFTGISAPYELPETPELTIDTTVAEVDACVRELVDYARKAFRM